MRTPPRHKSSDLPDDIDALKGAVGVLERELYNRDLLIEKLKHQLAGLRRHQFGSRSERLDQLEMRLEDEYIWALVNQNKDQHEKILQKIAQKENVSSPRHLSY